MHRVGRVERVQHLGPFRAQAVAAIATIVVLAAILIVLVAVLEADDHLDDH